MIEIKRRKWIEVSDDFDDFIREFKKKQQEEMKIRISIPDASQLLLKEIRRNGIKI